MDSILPHLLGHRNRGSLELSSDSLNQSRWASYMLWDSFTFSATFEKEILEIWQSSLLWSIDSLTRSSSWTYSELYLPDDCWVQLTRVQVNKAKRDGDGKLPRHTQDHSQNLKVLPENEKKVTRKKLKEKYLTPSDAALSNLEQDDVKWLLNINKGEIWCVTVTERSAD